MSKYAPLGARLRESGQDRVAMTFGEIETAIGAPLPASAYRHRTWWSNNPNSSTITRVWLEAGYKALEVDMQGQKLWFSKTAPEGQEEPAWPAASPAGQLGEAAAPWGAPVSGGAVSTGLGDTAPGALEGTVTVMPGTDLTAPLDEEWEAAS